MKNLIFVAVTFLMVACGNNKKDNDPGASATITIDGSSTVYPISEDLAE